MHYILKLLEKKYKIEIEQIKVEKFGRAWVIDLLEMKKRIILVVPVEVVYGHKSSVKFLNFY